MLDLDPCLDVTCDYYGLCRLSVRMMLAVYASTVVHHIKNQSVLQTVRLMITSVCLNKKCVCCSLTLPYSILAAVKVCRNGLNLHFKVFLNQSTPVKVKTGREGPWSSLGF